MEGIDVLYGSNTFILDNHLAMIFRLAKLWPTSHLALVKRLEINFSLGFDDTKRVPEREDLYGELFKLLQHRDLFSSLQQVRTWIMTLSFNPDNHRPCRLLTEDEADGWIGPWMELAASRPDTAFEFIVPPSWKVEFDRILAEKHDSGKCGSTSCGLTLLEGVDIWPYMSCLVN